jgi:hypothetical protein
MAVTLSAVLVDQLGRKHVAQFTVRARRRKANVSRSRTYTAEVKQEEDPRIATGCCNIINGMNVRSEGNVGLEAEREM